MNITELLQALGILFVLMTGASTLGYFVLMPFPKFEHPYLKGAAEISLGFLIISELLLGFALGKALYPALFITLLTVLIVMSIFGIYRSARWVSRNEARFSASWPQAAAMMIYAAVIFLFAALPSTARDELIYHLEIPKRLLAARGFFFFQDNIYAYFPQLAEMLMMFCLTVQGELLAKLIHPLYGMLLFAVLYGFSRRCLSRGFSFFAVLILASVPSVAATMAIAYVDLAFAVYALLALLALFQYFETRKLGWAAVAGMMSAGTLCIKYTGLHFTAILAVLAAAEHLQSRRPSFLKALLLLTAIPVLIASPYFIRNILMTGWPLFPFSYGGFALNPALNWDADRARLFHGWLNSFGTSPAGATLMDFIAAPILVFLQGRFEDPRYYDGDLGPVFLLLPFFMTGKKQEPWMKWMLGFCGLFFFYWIFSTKQIRFLLPIIPVLCFFLSWCAASCRHPRAMTAVILIGVAYGFFAGGRMLAAKQPLDYWLGRETREDYLTRNLENYAIYQKANQLLPRGARLYLINMKNYGYYLNTAWESDFVFERYVLDQQMKTVTRPSEILTFFQTRRISHLMIDERFIAAPEWGVEPHALELFKRFLAEHAESLHTDRGMTLYALKN